MTGRYKDRIIIPVRLNNELLGWTSRAIIDPKSAPRYLMSSEDVKTTVLNYDELKKGGERLFIVEGPFDAIRVDAYYDPNIVKPFRATCTFGTSVTLSQIALLRGLVKNYNQSYVLFDEGADEPARNLAEWIGAKVAVLPYNVKDPGELTFHHLNIMGRDTYTGGQYYASYADMTAALSRNLYSSSAQSLTKPNALLKKLSKRP
jgi:hypothetical protein